MSIFGTPSEIVILLFISIIMSIGLPLYFGLKFDWDPAEVETEVEPDAEASADISEGQAAADQP
ncbi:hypothetical protein DMJ13_20065 [halophilic archaeon]|nr:hypothetical protein DMJ13_20065 [halophilic archaeon]